MPYKNYIACLFLLISSVCFSQVKKIMLKAKDVPKTIPYKGKIVNIVRFIDTTGDNIIITTETGTYPSSDPSLGSDSELFAYNYILKENKWQFNWKVYDFIKECPVDIEANYVKDTFAVTDLNNDNNAEVWLMYTIVCHGDVTPANMKIIMHENSKKYAMRGENKVHYGNNNYLGGEYTFDDMFKQAPKPFRNYAIKLWNKNITGQSD